jgi:hypothetical protein
MSPMAFAESVEDLGADPSKVGFEFGEGHLDRIEVWVIHRLAP